MRKLLGVVLVAASVSTASAGPNPLDTLVKKSITELAHMSDDAALGLDGTSIVITGDGSVVDMTSHEGCQQGAVANAFFDCLQASIDHKIATVTTGTNGTIGWFEVAFTQVLTPDNPDGGTSTPEKTPMRAGGIALQVNGKWQIATLMYTTPVPDKKLLAGTGGSPASGAPKLTGDEKLASVVAGWFTAGFAPNAATKGTLIASGTSPTELKTGAAATTLVKAWDKLKLGATEIDAKLLAGGRVGWVTATVMLPRKNGKGAAAMKLAAILLPDGDAWRWVSLQYQPH